MRGPGAIWFISDLHLEAQQPELRALLRDLLSQLESEPASALYILGDLFEQWIGDDDDQPWLSEVAAALQRLRRAGTRVAFLHGNRDFLLGRTYAEQAGFELLPEFQVIDLFGTPTLLLHGDTLCSADTTYLQFRAQARDPRWQQHMLGLPLAVRRGKAAELRAASREHQRQQAADIIDADSATCEAEFARFGVRQIIHGHTHRPAVHLSAAGRRIVLGDWGPLPSFARFDANGGVLEFAGQRMQLEALS